MIRILLITGLHIENNSPNAQCVKQVVDKISNNKNIKLSVVSAAQWEKPNIRLWHKNVIISLKRLLYWPSVNPDIIKQRYHQAIRVSQNDPYDFVIGVHKPYEALYAAYKYKKRFPNVKMIIYELDPIVNSIDSKLGLGKYLTWLTRYSERRMYQRADCIFHMRCNQKQFSSNTYKSYEAKSEYLDFPLVINDRHQQHEACQYQGGQISFIYSGMLDMLIRSPEYLLKVLDRLNQSIPVIARFYCRGNCQEMLQKVKSQSLYIKVSDYIPKADLDNVISQSDFLLNISNKYSDMLPSKVLAYISTGKPIIHICNQKNDACIPYLDKYENSVILYEWDDIEVSVQKLKAFIFSSYQRIVSSDDVYNAFYENTPEYSADKIYDYCRTHLTE
ncbi:hypothetical protein [Aristaeella lactis]|uniref:Uncharacterized protein n=1 Tax=Aristaeella lactis TaxID=3046383 RepID=A0AC61PJ74_9FIRM|nr:hypothetical protein [Aristaeella lactis]QUA54043.1 hypothetical protein JYE50_05325 [Aristaeella lactis]SMC42697.1 hypothetical protein SAMN06297397_0879 [Aristaeella lactis]